MKFWSKWFYEKTGYLLFTQPFSKIIYLSRIVHWKWPRKNLICRNLPFFRAQTYQVEIPNDLECKDCTVRLIRQALEWNEKYLFWSCADVDILKTGYSEDCSGHGKAFAGRCSCSRLYYGHRCQYQDECIKDDDCGRRGRCIDIDATTAPRKQCFCQLGYFGPGCAQGELSYNAIWWVSICLLSHNGTCIDLFQSHLSKKPS